VIEVTAGTDKGRKQRLYSWLLQEYPTKLPVESVARAIAFAGGQQDVFNHPDLLKWCVGNVVEQCSDLSRAGFKRRCEGRRLEGLSVGRVVGAYLSHDGLDRLAAKSVAPPGDMTHRR
jgi:hypothetical protein